MKHTKIAIIGAGSVGSTTAYALMLKNINAEIMLTDINMQRCVGEIYDLSDALSFCEAFSVHACDAQQAGQADIIIIAAGVHQQPGQSRTDLLDINKQVVLSIIASIKPVAPHAIIIMVTNPVDILTLYAQENIDLPRNQIFGSGTLLDSQRLRVALAEKYAVSPQSVDAYMLGQHGDLQFAAWSAASIDGVRVMNLPHTSPCELAEIEKQVIQKAAEIIACKGATYFGIASCIAEICAAIIFNKKVIMPLSCYIEKFDVCLSLPVVIGKKGIEKIVEMSLSQTEQQELEKAAQQIKALKKD